MGDIIVIISKAHTTQKKHNHSMVDKWICYHRKRAQWEAIPHEGDIPTPEEWLYYAVNILIENGDEDLLRWYPNL